MYRLLVIDLHIDLSDQETETAGTRHQQWYRRQLLQLPTEFVNLYFRCPTGQKLRCFECF